MEVPRKEVRPRGSKGEGEMWRFQGRWSIYFTRPRCWLKRVNEQNVGEWPGEAETVEVENSGSQYRKGGNGEDRGSKSETGGVRARGQPVSVGPSPLQAGNIGQIKEIE